MSSLFSSRVRAVAAGLAVVLGFGGFSVLRGTDDDARSAAVEAAAAAPAPAPPAAEPAAPEPPAVAEAADAPADVAPAPTEPPRPLTVPERLEQIVSSVGDRHVAVAIVDDAGNTVIERNPDAPVIPASTTKLVTAAAALAELGPDFRWQTRVASTARVNDGVINGDVVVVGAGDPTLSGGRYAEAVPERPRTPLEGLADRIAAAGATRITGRLIADAGFFPNQPFADGVAKVGGDSSPPSSGLMTDGSRKVWHNGAKVESVPAADPAVETVNLLAAALAVRGVTIEGGIGRADGAAATAPHPLADVNSPPLIDVLRYLVQRSDNHLADAVFRTMGARRGDGSWANSARVTTTALERIGFDTSRIAVADGSGLSRNGRVTAASLVHLDEVMAKTRYASEWYSLYAVAGSSGTLRGRLLDTPAAGRVGGKTGTLSDVRALAGFVTDGERPRFRFTVVGNGLDRPGLEAVTKAQDEIALVLAERAAACAGQSTCPAA
ncbi:MAG TPA: D-alanyl-D-alanine carboxypeptidase/D-alanyl-D-alanine-endopeptidase [Acidimicrobiales bacterium]|nr:D-alanyl-D-alanine carboxypeptidase/D-alanyl-D-alanine-endopeptidase [Acidimicrobiales bacterium]